MSQISPDKTAFDRIVKWNIERQLIKEPDLEKETSFVIEELLEMNTDMDSKTARPIAKQITKSIVQPGYKPTREQVLDAAADGIVFLTGLMAKLDADPNKVMDEVLKEIESRAGKIIDGKFVKDQHVKTYKANLSNC